MLAHGTQASMKYWSFLMAKLLAAGGLLWGLRKLLVWLVPPPDASKHARFGENFSKDFNFAFAMWVFYLSAAGIVWLVLWDQRYRCRACLRRLRMPVHTGSWTHVLFGAPRTEYICLYGHGTLKVDELQIHGDQIRDWEPHEDMWKELFSLAETKK